LENEKTRPWPGLHIPETWSLPVVMVMVAMMVTRLRRGYSACKHCECDDGEHQIANLHGESSSNRAPVAAQLFL